MDSASNATKMSGSRPMNAGEGPKSYAKNSTYQRYVINVAKDAISQAISETMDINKPQFNPLRPFRIADLGCSTGQNTIIAMQNIVEAVEHTYKTTNISNSSLVPEFQVFFNDQTNNDFSTLFHNLTTLKRKYFVAGVPGSFYERLFPQKSLQIVHSSFALHWLSKVPNGVQDKSSLAYNKDHIHCSGDDEIVTRAYVAQFEMDMGNFLEARAQELVDGGLLFIQMPGGRNRSNEIQSNEVMNEFLGQSLFDLAKMGYITEEKVHSFNLPCYYPSVDLIETTIHKNNCFSTESIRLVTLPDEIPLMTPKMSSLALRSAYEGLIKEHFGSEIMNQLFDILTQKVEKYNIQVYNKEKKVHDKDNKPPPTAILFGILKRHGFYPWA